MKLAVIVNFFFLLPFCDKAINEVSNIVLAREKLRGIERYCYLDEVFTVLVVQNVLDERTQRGARGPAPLALDDVTVSARSGCQRRQFRRMHSRSQIKTPASGKADRGRKKV